jgi:hypothetical protein
MKEKNLVFFVCVLIIHCVLFANKKQFDEKKKRNRHAYMCVVCFSSKISSSSTQKKVFFQTELL